MPLVLLLAIIVTAPVNHLMFYIDDTNVYCRGPLFFIQTIINFGHLIIASVHALRVSKHTSIYRVKIEAEALALSAVPVVIFGCTQVLCQEAPTLCIGATLSLVYVYLSLQEQAISVDSLTGINNRASLYSYLKTYATLYEEDVISAGWLKENLSAMVLSEECWNEGMISDDQLKLMQKKYFNRNGKLS